MLGHGTSDTAWARGLINKVQSGNPDGAEADWHEAKQSRRDLQDLRRASVELMKGYNAAGRWIDTIRFFKWNEDADRLEARRKRKTSDVIPRKRVALYLAELDLRAKQQEQDPDYSAFRKKLLDEKASNDPVDEMGYYIEELRDALFRLKKLPREYIEKPIPPDELERLSEELRESPFIPSTIPTKALDECLKALLGRLDTKRVLILFHQYRHLIRFSNKTWELVVSAYLQQGEINRAQGLIRYAIYKKQKLSYYCFVKVLAAVKNDGGGWSKLVRYFKWLERAAIVFIPELYHIMVQSAIELGMNDQAEVYLKKMADRGVGYTAKACGALMSAQAKNGDWTGLQRTLDVIDAEGFSIPVGAFNAVLNAYADMGSLAETEAFFSAGLVRGIIPDIRTYNIMLKACVYGGTGVNEKILSHWLDRITQSGIKPDHVTLNTLFQDLRKNFKASAALLRRLYNKILGMNTSVKMMDETTKEMLHHSTHHESKVYGNTYRQICDDDDGLSRNQQALALRMASAIEARKPGEALELWRKHLLTGVPPSFQVILHALRACVLSDSKDHHTAGILHIAKTHGIEIPKTILYIIKYSVRKLSPTHISNHEDVNDLYDGHDIYTSTKVDKTWSRVEESYRFLEKHNIAITHHVAVHSANRFINAGDPDTAIRLLNQVSLSTWGREAPFDYVGISVILKAYCAAGQLNGVQWVAERIIANNYMPSTACFKLLHIMLRCMHPEDEKQIIFMKALIWKLKVHRKNLKQAAKKRSQLVVDFVRNTVRIDGVDGEFDSRVRKYGPNWPLVTRLGGVDVFEKQETRK